ncbi:MAG: pyridoxal 5'-phosphate synthase glutaminase subunit PdxT [Actinomycetes bacterium]
MTAPVIGVLALQGDVREHVEALTAVGAQAVTVRRRTELDAVDALVLPGGESTTMARLAATFDLLEPLRSAVAAGLPVYGTCAGMILLADTILDGRDDQQTIGGIDMTVRRNAFGRQIDSFETDVTVAAIGDDPFHAVFIRAPWVEAVGRHVEVLARLESGPAAGTIVAVRQGRLLATSFHPELTGDTRFHRFFVDQVRAS